MVNNNKTRRKGLIAAAAAGFLFAHHEHVSRGMDSSSSSHLRVYNIR